MELPYAYVEQIQNGRKMFLISVIVCAGLTSTQNEYVYIYIHTQNRGLSENQHLPSVCLPLKIIYQHMFIEVFLCVCLLVFFSSQSITLHSKRKRHWFDAGCC